MMKKFSPHHRPRGFTLIELTIALVVLTMLSIFSGQLYLNYTNASRNLKGANLVYEEARYLMEKMVREIRQNGIDYEQYFNQNVMIPLNGEGTYTDNYCSYSSFFYNSGIDGNPETLEDNESRGVRNPERLLTIPGSPEAVIPIERELYLINISGNKRTVLTRVSELVNGDTIGKVALLKMDGLDYGADHINSQNPSGGSPPTADPLCEPDDGENDGLIDSWHCATGFPCKIITDTFNPVSGCIGLTHLVVKEPSDPNYSFVDISPNALNVVDLKFMIAPADDPWKAYNMNEYQIQPHVTIQMTVEANPKMVSATGNHPPSITLTSTITARNYNEINSDCRK